MQQLHGLLQFGTEGLEDVKDLDFSIAPNPVMHGSMVNVSVDGADMQGAEIKVYDIQGRKVERTSKGIYIVNGKKVVMK